MIWVGARMAVIEFRDPKAVVPAVSSPDGRERWWRGENECEMSKRSGVEDGNLGSRRGSRLRGSGRDAAEIQPNDTTFFC